MRRPLLAILIASLLAGCGAPTMADRPVKRQMSKNAPVVRVLPNAPSVTVVATKASAEAVEASTEAITAMLEADAGVDAIELLIQDGGAYMIAGWFTDLKDWVKRTWTRWKLSREVKKDLKASQDKARAIHGKEIDAIRENRGAVKTEINDLGEGVKEIVNTWTSTHQGTFAIETRRAVDDEGVTQNLSIAIDGKDKKGQAIVVSRISTLTGEDGTYKVATVKTVTDKAGRKEHQEWLKLVAADGTATMTGFIVHRDGHRTEFKGTRDAKGKVKVAVEKITPAKQ